MGTRPHARPVKVCVYGLRLLVAALILTAFPAQARERLIMIGGGARPSAAIARFAAWAGQDRARIIVIPWATSEPQSSFKSLAQDFAPFHPAMVELAPTAPLSPAAKDQFMAQLKSATGVFFTGGDQVKIMKVLEDQSLVRALRERYHNGVVFGGTSAGTAIMSWRMITGEGDFTVIDGQKVETREGLGLLPKDIIVDQHFIKRQRENRLFGLILQNHGALGVGIDEGTALVVTDNRYAEVVGASQVMMIEAGARPAAMVLYLVKPGESIDLLKRAPEKRTRSTE